jgi:hypothetical protein
MEGTKRFRGRRYMRDSGVHTRGRNHVLLAGVVHLLELVVVDVGLGERRLYAVCHVGLLSHVM